MQRNMVSVVTTAFSERALVVHQIVRSGVSILIERTLSLPHTRCEKNCIGADKYLPELCLRCRDHEIYDRDECDDPLSHHLEGRYKYR